MIRMSPLIAAAHDPAALRILPDDILFEPYAFALPRGDSAMRLAVNRALSQLSTTGEIDGQLSTTGEIDGIFRRWLGQYGRPTGLLAAMFILDAIPENAQQIEEVLARAKAEDDRVQALAQHAAPAGEANPYRDVAIDPEGE